MSSLYHGQVLQDKFVANVTSFKKDGFFLEIGSNDPIRGNNSYFLETQLNWRGIMVEYLDTWVQQYKIFRQKSIHIIGDAQVLDYRKVLQDFNAPKDIDYLQIDLDEENGSTLNTLKKIQDTVFQDYKFAAVTFEHDIYRSNVYNTRVKSREIFSESGYIPVFLDVHIIGPDENRKPTQKVFEDWYVNPQLVDMDYISNLQLINQIKYCTHNLVGRTINGADLIYPTR